MVVVKWLLLIEKTQHHQQLWLERSRWTHLEQALAHRCEMFIDLYLN